MEFIDIRGVNNFNNRVVSKPMFDIQKIKSMVANGEMPLVDVVNKMADKQVFAPYLNKDGEDLVTYEDGEQKFIMQHPELTQFIGSFYNFFASYEGKELDLTLFDTSNAVSLQRMFSTCYDLETLDLSSFNTSKVTSMKEMFDCCTKLSNIIGIDNFDMSNVTNKEYMFHLCRKLGG